MKGKNIKVYDSNKDIQDIINEENENSKYSAFVIEKINNVIHSTPSFNKERQGEIQKYINYKKSLNKFRENDKIKELKKLILI